VDAPWTFSDTGFLQMAGTTSLRRPSLLEADVNETVVPTKYEGTANEKAPPSKPEDGAPSHVGFAPIIGRHG